jgi:hypothetical protein
MHGSKRKFHLKKQEKSKINPKKAEGNSKEEYINETENKPKKAIEKIHKN